MFKQYTIAKGRHNKQYKQYKRLRRQRKEKYNHICQMSQRKRCVCGRTNFHIFITKSIEMNLKLLKTASRLNRILTFLHRINEDINMRSKMGFTSLVFQRCTSFGIVCGPWRPPQAAWATSPTFLPHLKCRINHYTLVHFKSFYTSKALLLAYT